MTLSPGADFRAPVTGAGSQGYRWIVTVTGDVGTIEAAVTGIPPVQLGGVGSFARELSIRARKPGVARVELALVHSGGRTREQHSIVVHVTPGAAEPGGSPASACISGPDWQPPAE